MMKKYYPLAIVFSFLCLITSCSDDAKSQFTMEEMLLSVDNDKAYTHTAELTVNGVQYPVISRSNVESTGKSVYAYFLMQEDRNGKFINSMRLKGPAFGLQRFLTLDVNLTPAGEQSMLVSGTKKTRSYELNLNGKYTVTASDGYLPAMTHTELAIDYSVNASIVDYILEFDFNDSPLKFTGQCSQGNVEIGGREMTRYEAVQQALSLVNNDFSTRNDGIRIKMTSDARFILSKKAKGSNEWQEVCNTGYWCDYEENDVYYISMNNEALNQLSEIFYSREGEYSPNGLLISTAYDFLPLAIKCSGDYVTLAPTMSRQSSMARKYGYYKGLDTAPNYNKLWSDENLGYLQVLHEEIQRLTDTNSRDVTDESVVWRLRGRLIADQAQ